MNAPACRQCDHPQDAHQHYAQAGRAAYCGQCGCWKYQPERPWARFLAWFRRRLAPVPAADVLHPQPVRLPVPDGDEGESEDRTRLDIQRARPYAPRPAGAHRKESRP